MNYQNSLESYGWSNLPSYYRNMCRKNYRSVVRYSKVFNLSMKESKAFYMTGLLDGFCSSPRVYK